MIELGSESKDKDCSARLLEGRILLDLSDTSLQVRKALGLSGCLCVVSTRYDGGGELDVRPTPSYPGVLFNQTTTFLHLAPVDIRVLMSCCMTIREERNDKPSRRLERGETALAFS